MTIETGRLLLRPWREADAAALYRWASDPQVGPVAGWPPHTSVEDSLSVIRTVFSAPETYAVQPRQQPEPVGCAGLMFGAKGTAPLGVREAEIGYWIARPYWGQGFAPEAVRALLRRAFDELDCEAVWCGYYDGNEKSRRVQEKCGFLPHHTAKNRRTGLGDRRTEHFTRITRTQWLAQTGGTPAR